MSESVFERLSGRLRQQGIAFEVMHHEAVYTSSDAARVRGTSLASGAKALVCRADGEFVMIVMPADRKLASKAVRKQNNIKSLRFANGDEVDRLTGLKPGSIPPFGSLFDLPTWCDERLAEEDAINFNAGDHSISIQMTYAAYAQAERPVLGNYSQ